MNKNKIIYLLTLVIVATLGSILYLQYLKNKNVLPANIPISNNDNSNNNASSTNNTSIVYTNQNLGFNFFMPDSWKGYSVVSSTWEGNSLKPTSTKQMGPKFLIRNPNWTPALPYEDIPVLVFTINQWNSYTAGNFSVSAAPFAASELGRNNVYVFALPPRWDFDYSKGYQEAQSIVKSNPLKTFDINIKTSGKLDINFVCQDALTYMRFKDSESMNKFISECKEGKYPEIIEKYKAQMNIKSDAAI